MKKDLVTNDLEGAKQFELLHNTEIEETDCEEENEDEDECNCSDWGCPCGGNKYGSL